MRIDVNLSDDCSEFQCRISPPREMADNLLFFERIRESQAHQLQTQKLFRPICPRAVFREGLLYLRFAASGFAMHVMYHMCFIFVFYFDLCYTASWFAIHVNVLICEWEVVYLCAGCIFRSMFYYLFNLYYLFIFIFWYLITVLYRVS